MMEAIRFRKYSVGEKKRKQIILFSKKGLGQTLRKQFNGKTNKAQGYNCQHMETSIGLLKETFGRCMSNRLEVNINTVESILD